MDHDFWLDRWRDGATGWHRTDPHPVLVHHGPRMGWTAGGRILVPLCGATPDLGWLREAGFRPVGVELSPIACARFFTDRGLTPTRRRDGPHTRWEAGGIVILQGDVFALADDEGFDGLYDRAATIALPAPLRARYAATVAANLLPGAPGLLITLQDPSRGDDGPPFSVDADAVHAAWGPHTDLARQPPVDGQSPLEGVWRLVRTPDPVR